MVSLSAGPGHDGQDHGVIWSVYRSCDALKEITVLNDIYIYTSILELAECCFKLLEVLPATASGFEH